MNELELISYNESCCSIDTKRRSHHSPEVKKNFTSRLNHIEGQIRGIKGLIDNDIYCDDIITQIASIQSALNSVSMILLKGHLNNCISERVQEGDQKVIDELLNTIKRLMK
ncbi:metal-sensitive transcriptional regulator [Priestia filamentosa]|uniref:metal-sensitive transcriptional regulator n=1 Tax=Priestia filamentosa TaxID=1402861 RepID=UPI00397831FD